jgi:diacylglycerol kinase
MSLNKFSFSERIKSFKFAFNGLRVLFRDEHNARIHLFIALIVIITGFIFCISNLEWVAVIFAIGFVITTEIINTAIEQIANFISPEKNENIKKIKDLSAAAVLISSIAAFIIGLFIFIPKIIDWAF